MERMRSLVDDALYNFLRVDREVPSVLKEAMAYSLFPGGKRLRSILTLATAEALECPPEPVLPFACALEMIHTYSLIHDDLPAMDDDDTRRGRPTNHKVYGEAIAILAGDALLTKAFGIMTKSEVAPGVEKTALLALIREASFSAGAEGMVGGQVADILSEKKRIALEELYGIHRRKTGALLKLAVRAGAILAGANEIQLARLTTYAEKIGLAFQIQDDILDVIGDQEKIGKPVGSDQEKEKATFPAFLGLSQSKEQVRLLVSEAKKCLETTPGIHAGRLCDIADYLARRDH